MNQGHYMSLRSSTPQATGMNTTSLLHNIPVDCSDDLPGDSIHDDKTNFDVDLNQGEQLPKGLPAGFISTMKSAMQVVLDDFKLELKSELRIDLRTTHENLKSELTAEIKATHDNAMKDLNLVKKDIKAAHDDVKLVKAQFQMQINSLTVSTEEAHNRIKDLEIENKALKEQIVGLEKNQDYFKAFQLKQMKENKTMLDKSVSLELYQRRENLVFEGISQDNNENCEEKVKYFLRNSFKLNDADNFRMVACHRMRPQKNKTPTPIICRFAFRSERQAVWNARKNLKGTKIFVKEDFPEEVLRKRAVLYPILKAAVRNKKKATLQADKLIIESRAYTVETLNELPPELNPAEISTVRANNVTAFFTAANPLSNFYPTPSLFIAGRKYETVEQYFQSEKASFGNNPGMASRIRLESNPAKCKAMGGQIQVAECEWLPRARDVMYRACKAKFTADPVARQFLFNTGSTTLAEAGPDTTWGTGAKLNDVNVCDLDKCPGKNELGKILQQIRDELKRDSS